MADKRTTDVSQVREAAACVKYQNAIIKLNLDVEIDFLPGPKCKITSQSVQSIIDIAHVMRKPPLNPKAECSNTEEVVAIILLKNPDSKRPDLEVPPSLQAKADMECDKTVEEWTAEWEEIEDEDAGTKEGGTTTASTIAKTDAAATSQDEESAESS